MEKDKRKNQKQLTEKRVREIASEEAQKALSEYCRGQGEIFSQIILERMKSPLFSDTHDNLE